MMFLFLIGSFLRDDETMNRVGHGYIRFVFSATSHIRTNLDTELKSTIDGELKQTDKMKASSLVFTSIVLFVVMASLHETSEAFVVSLTARRDKLKMEERRKRLEEQRVERRLQELENEEQDMQRRVRHLRKWVQRHKVANRAKTAQQMSSAGDH